MSTPTTFAATWQRFYAAPYLLLTLTTLFWAVNWVFARALRDDFGPLTLSLLRWCVALAVLVPLCAASLWRERATLWRHWKLFTWLSLTGTGAYNALSFKGLQTTTALNGTLLNTLIPMVTMLLSLAFLGERLQTRRVLGMLLGVAGAAWIAALGDWQRLLSLQFVPGDLWVAAGMTSWAIYTMLLKQRSDQLSQLTLLTALALIGVIPLLPMAAWEMAYVQAPRFSADGWWKLLYMGLFPSIVCYVFWNRGVELAGAPRASLFVYLIPLFGAVLSAWWLAEYLQGHHLAGAALIIPGLILATRNPKTAS